MVRIKEEDAEEWWYERTQARVVRSTRTKEKDIYICILMEL